MNFNVNEWFGSLQGEGERTGIPSVFVRTNGCNLRCQFGHKDAVTGKVICGSRCDTPYTSFNPEQTLCKTVEDILDPVTKYFLEHKNINDLVLTGGCPMLQQRGMSEFIWQLKSKMYESDLSRQLFVTVETNGTVTPHPGENWSMLVNLWSISPKLESSCCHPDQNSHDAIQHRKNRFNPAATIGYILTGIPIQWKFVYSGPESENEIKKFFDDTKRYIIDVYELGVITDKAYEKCMSDLRNANIMIMPEGTIPEEISKSAETMIDCCIRNGWRFCDRLHIRLFGNKRAV